MASRWLRSVAVLAAMACGPSTSIGESAEEMLGTRMSQRLASAINEISPADPYEILRAVGLQLYRCAGFHTVLAGRPNSDKIGGGNHKIIATVFAHASAHLAAAIAQSPDYQESINDETWLQEILHERAKLTKFLALCTRMADPSLAKASVAEIALRLTTSPPVVPSLKKSMLYAEAREMVVASGWSPAGLFQHDVLQNCMSREDVCARYPETVSCSGSGLGLCRFAFKNSSSRTLIIITKGELVESLQLEEWFVDSPRQQTPTPNP